jgi:hypothetical protein
MGVVGAVAALVCAGAVWRRSRRSGRGLGPGLGCLPAGGVALVLVVAVWAAVVVLGHSDLGLVTP